MDKYAAHNYFSGRYLEAARAIDRSDLAAMKQHLAGKDVNFIGKKQMDLLWYAVMKKDLTAVTELVRLGASPSANKVDGLGTVLGYASTSYPDTTLLAALLDGGMPVTNPTPDTSLIELSLGSSTHTLERVKLLVERGANVNWRDSIGKSELARSIREPDVAIYLISKGAAIDTFTSIGVTPAYSLDLALKDFETMEPKYPSYQKFLELKALMIAKGAKFPADPPEVIRDRMRSQGLSPVVPSGRER
jgi:uncharacterized protein